MELWESMHSCTNVKEVSHSLNTRNLHSLHSQTWKLGLHLIFLYLLYLLYCFRILEHHLNILCSKWRNYLRISSCCSPQLRFFFLSAGNQKGGQESVRKNNGVGQLCLWCHPSCHLLLSSSSTNPYPLSNQKQTKNNTHITWGWFFLLLLPSTHSSSSQKNLKKQHNNNKKGRYPDFICHYLFFFSSHKNGDDPQ